MINFFGKHVFFHDTDQEGIVSSRLKISEDAMPHWVMEHANIVKVTTQKNLVERIQGEIRKAGELYGL